MCQVAGFVFDCIYKGTNMARRLGTEEWQDLVQYGFARFQQGVDGSGINREASVDEPLPLLASLNYFEKNGWPRDAIFTIGLTDPYPSGRGIIFEYFCVYLLALAFRSYTCLSDVFTFANKVPQELREQKARLVMVRKVGNEYRSYPVDITSDQGRIFLFGHTCGTADDTLSWLQAPHTAYCFPAKEVGADAISFLQLPDGSLLRLVMQFKNHTSNSMGQVKTDEAFLTTDPANFCSAWVQEPQSPNKSSDKLPGPRKRTRNRFAMLSHVIYVFLSIDPQVPG
jgi:hypothetical protein